MPPFRFGLTIHIVYTILFCGGEINPIHSGGLQARCVVASGEVSVPFLSTSRRSPDVSRIGFYSDPYSLRRVTTKTILFAELLPEEQNCLDPI